MKRILFILAIFCILLIQCSRRSQDYSEEEINNQSESLNYTEIEYTHLIDYNYLELFKAGKFNEIITLHTNRDDSIYDISQESDFRNSMYYLSLLEVTKDANMLVVLENVDTSCYDTSSYNYDRYIYRECLLEQLGPYMLHAILVYDFMNYHRYGMWNFDLYFEMYHKLGENSENDIFHSMEDDFRYDSLLGEEHFDSLRLEYDNWSYIDSVQKYLAEACRYRSHDW